MNEFELIKKFCNRPINDSNLIKGIGDDAAVLRVPEGFELVVSTDTLIEGVHFPRLTKTEDVAYKSMMVNLSDIAAMGAEPKWMLCSLTLPSNDEAWLEAFSKGLFEALDKHQVALIGGDTCKGPLSITAQAMGLVKKGKAVYRSGARPGDNIYVTGTLGGAGYALSLLQANQTVDEILLKKLNRPEAQVAEGQILNQYASAIIDISDGLVADCHHIADESGVKLEIDADYLPLHSLLPKDKGKNIALNAGDDYELCFTLPPEYEAVLLERVSCTRIGRVVSGHGVVVHNAKQSEREGYQHF